MSTLDEILSMLEAETELSSDELMGKIKEKQDELSGLVSEEGAAHLIAKDMGVNLLNSEKRRIELKNVLAGMRNVSAIGKVFQISDIINFKKSNGSEGRVVNLFIGDSTGFVRLPLWNDKVKMVEDDMINLGDVVQVSGAYAKENIYGDTELSIGKYGKVFTVTDEAEGMNIDFPSVDEMEKVYLGPQNSRIPIKNLSEGSHEIKGTVIDVRSGNFIFNTCPKCGKKVRSVDDGKFECDSHGEVEAKPEMVVSFIADDGTGAIRVVAFRDTAEKLTTTDASELSKLSVDERHSLLTGSMVGKEFIINGRVKRNKRFDRTEMIANSVQPLDVSKESEKLAELLKLKLKD